MTIHLPEPLKSSILAAVHSGRFASVDDAMAEPAALLVQRLQHEQVDTRPTAANQPEEAPTFKPIWEVAVEIRKSVPAEEWDTPPTDGAEQLDHYVYGTPKRPKS
jgi:Arc/MetJ-type ribon-helix-helix transcriptional regulator